MKPYPLFASIILTLGILQGLNGQTPNRPILETQGSASIVAGYSRSKDAFGPFAGFNYPLGIASDGTNLYVTELYNGTIRKIGIANQMVSTLAGKAGESGLLDGTGDQARFGELTGICYHSGKLYVIDNLSTADSGVCSIRSIDTVSGEVKTVYTLQEGKIVSSSIVYRNGELFFLVDSDAWSERQRILKLHIDNSQIVSLLPDQLIAELSPINLTLAGDSLILIGKDYKTISKIDIETRATSTITTLNISPSEGNFYLGQGIVVNGNYLYLSSDDKVYRVDCDTGNTSFVCQLSSLAPVNARYWNGSFRLSGMVCSGAMLHITDSENKCIYAVDMIQHSVKVLAGTEVFGSSDIRGTRARFDELFGIATDGKVLFVSDRNTSTIARINPQTGVVQNLAGGYKQPGFVDGPLAEARFNLPSGLACDGRFLYVADSGNRAIRRIDLLEMTVKTIARKVALEGYENEDDDQPLAPGLQGLICNGTDLYLNEMIFGSVWKINSLTGVVSRIRCSWGKNYYFDQTEFGRSFSLPWALATDGKNLYVSDRNESAICSIDLANGKASTFAGYPGTFGFIDGPRETIARFFSPQGIILDRGNLYIADYNNSAIRKINLATGKVSTVARIDTKVNYNSPNSQYAETDYPGNMVIIGSTLYYVGSKGEAIWQVTLADNP